MTFSTFDTDVNVGPLQLECLRVLWRVGPSTVEQVEIAVNADHRDRQLKQLAYTTILTVLRNMLRRGVVTRVLRATGGSGHRAHIYKAARTEADFRREQGRSWLAANFDGDIKKLQEAIA